MPISRRTPKKVINDPGLEQVVGYMRKFAHQGARDPDIIAINRRVCRNLQSGDYGGECLAAYYWVCSNVRYMRDPYGVELVQWPIRTVDTGAGDCDDMATLLAAMCMALGNQCRFALVGFSPGGPPTHVYCEVRTPSGFKVLDPVAKGDIDGMLGRVRFKKLVNV